MTNEVDEMSAHRHGTPLFSQRSAMAAAAVEWCDSANAAVCPVNIVTALFSLGLVVKPTLTEEEQLAIAWAAREADEWDEEDTPEVAAHAEALRGLAKRLF
jgi:hypothetical protein